jgi:protein-disulfide isomerase/type II secretory pathway component PulC
VKPRRASLPPGWSLPLLIVTVALAACGRPPETVPAQQQDDSALGTPDSIVARVGESAILASEADAPLQLALHDLAVQQYRLRRQSLEARLLDELESLPDDARVAEILLVPPSPPRLAVEPDPARTRPAEDAPVTIVAFCNFESPHCARLQRVLSQVLPLFPGVVRYAERDLPLGFHHHAGKAAEAARCALEQGNYWRFHDQLYAQGTAPDRTTLDRVARAARLQTAAFTACLDSGRNAAAVGADVAAARSVGATAVPAVFVNGLYASPDVTPADLVSLIERELVSLGLSSPRSMAAETASTAPLLLRAILASPHPGQGLVLVAPSIAPGSVKAYREGDLLMTGVVLRRVASTHVELWRNGRAERLDWAAGPAAPQHTTAAPDEQDPVIRPHLAVPVTLDRERVLVLMSDRIGLERSLAPVEMTVGPYHLLRVQAVEPDGLYELLGIEAGDVLLMVNEQPVHEASNPLWDALEKESEVRLRVMRSGGLARHYTYRFND